MDSLIDLTAVDYPGNKKRFILIYNLLSVSKNFRIKVKIKTNEDNPVPLLQRFILVQIGMKEKFGIFLE